MESTHSIIQHTASHRPPAGHADHRVTQRTLCIRSHHPPSRPPQWEESEAGQRPCSLRCSHSEAQGAPPGLPAGWNLHVRGEIIHVPSDTCSKSKSVSRTGHHKEASGGRFDNGIKNNGICWLTFDGELRNVPFGGRGSETRGPAACTQNGSGGGKSTEGIATGNQE